MTMILYVENPKASTHKLLELINKFSKIAGYKINIQKSVAFPYTNNEISERENKQTKILLKITSKRIKYLRIKLTKEGASLVAQWLRICLPMQRTRVRALVWEDPTCRGATRPVSHNY